MEYNAIMWGKLKVSVYEGKRCDEHRLYWNIYSEGNKQDENLNLGETMKLFTENFPPGTKIVISIPVCPKCEDTCENCSWGFDWYNWVEEEYS